jgi:hypothetical protein
MKHACESKQIHKRFSQGNLKGVGLFRNRRIWEGKVNVDRIWCKSGEWIQLAQDRVPYRAVVNTVVKHRGQPKAGNVSTSWVSYYKFGVFSLIVFSPSGATALSGPGPPHYRGFRSYSLRHTTLGRTPLDEWSARRRDLYLTTHNTHNRQTAMLQAGFEPAIPASERRQTHASPW